MPQKQRSITENGGDDRSVEAAARRGTGPDLAAVLDGWSSVGHGTLPRRLAHALRLAVQAGVLPPGWRLPPERRLAADLAVSRATVTEALDELRDEGLATSTQGRGTFVAGGPRHRGWARGSPTT